MRRARTPRKLNISTIPRPSVLTTSRDQTGTRNMGCRPCRRPRNPQKSQRIRQIFSKRYLGVQRS